MHACSLEGRYNTLEVIMSLDVFFIVALLLLSMQCQRYPSLFMETGLLPARASGQDVYT